LISMNAMTNWIVNGQRFNCPKRKDEVKRIKTKFPDRIPIFTYKGKLDKAPDLDKHKFLVPPEMTWGQFVYVVRKRIKLDPEQALILPPTTMLLAEAYKLYSDDYDEMLYIKYTLENTFG
jgi:GABA(A) receptor-associated protein